MRQSQTSMPLRFISSESFLGIGRHEQFFWCPRCHSILCSTVGFFGILFFSCHSLFVVTWLSGLGGYISLANQNASCERLFGAKRSHCSGLSDMR